MLCLATAPACERGAKEVAKAELHMGTIVEIKAMGPDSAKLLKAVDKAFEEIERVERLMSAYDPDSDVSRINASAGGPLVEVSPEVYELIKGSLEVSKKSGGAFDITAAGLSGLWSFDSEDPKIPSKKEIEERLSLVSWNGVKLAPSQNKVGLAKKGMSIDLGAIAKGYAVDMAVKALKEQGITMAMVNAGGDLRCLGAHDDRPWNFGIRDPREKGALIGKVELIDRAIATSGDYEKFMMVEGKRYCHILDPRTGRPASKTRSATIVCERAWMADALATAVFVLGPEKGMELVKSLPGVESLIIDKQGKLSQSPGFKAELF